MVNSNQDKNVNEELKLSPLGTDEINSVIKSFKMSSFNQEELYKNDKKNFVKKSLFDLAKESERNVLYKNQRESDISLEKNKLERKIDPSQEIVNESEKENDPDITHSLNDLDKNNDSKEKEADLIHESVDEDIKSDQVQEQKIKSEHNVENEDLKENINQDDQVSDEKTFDTKPSESNKIEYEEKTLEALDSVREAVSKSLEEKSLEKNSEIQNEEIKNKTEDKEIVTNNIISEIDLINTLFKNIREMSNNEIENIVKSKVIELAEGVIGYQIEKFPDKFLSKIKKSINEIKSINNDIKIYLNDNDLEFLNKFIDKNKVEINCELDADSSLGRGDFTIDIGGVIQAIKYKKVID